jgi:hypothetical protein
MRARISGGTVGGWTVKMPNEWPVHGSASGGNVRGRQPPNSAAKPAPIVLLAEPDYCYGTGTLRLKIEHVDVSDPVDYDGERWYRVRGVHVRSDGAELSRIEVLVRGRRLPPQMPDHCYH